MKKIREKKNSSDILIRKNDNKEKKKKIILFKNSDKEIRIRMKTFDLNSLLKVQLLLEKLALTCNFTYSSINLPLEIKRINLLKSPHVNKKARDLYEVRFYNRLFILKVNLLTSNFLESLKELSLTTVSLKLSIISKHG